MFTVEWSSLGKMGEIGKSCVDENGLARSGEFRRARRVVPDELYIYVFLHTCYELWTKEEVRVQCH